MEEREGGTTGEPGERECQGEGGMELLNQHPHPPDFAL